MVWVKAHIAAFGGDGDDVTIFGESAGGNSVINHLAQPTSFGLYKKAVVESGAYDVGSAEMSVAETGYQNVLAKTECADLPCLRAKPAADIEAAASAMPFVGPIVDGVSLSKSPAALITDKTYNSKVPVLIGSNRDEEAFFLPLYYTPPNLSEKAFDAHLGGKGGYR